jgi:hypothetical protein
MKHLHAGLVVHVVVRNAAGQKVNLTPAQHAAMRQEVNETAGPMLDALTEVINETLEEVVSCQTKTG